MIENKGLKDRAAAAEKFVSDTIEGLSQEVKDEVEKAARRAEPKGGRNSGRARAGSRK